MLSRANSTRSHRSASFSTTETSENAVLRSRSQPSSPQVPRSSRSNTISPTRPSPSSLAEDMEKLMATILKVGHVQKDGAIAAPCRNLEGEATIRKSIMQTQRSSALLSPPAIGSAHATLTPLSSGADSIASNIPTFIVKPPSEGAQAGNCNMLVWAEGMWTSFQKKPDTVSLIMRVLPDFAN